ncbi:MAG TPA: FAD binding domain-containing protein [Gaiellaceae bacterium]|nr:FAD binding domain-containing protein [Gaiellaceae bacterium]
MSGPSPGTLAEALEARAAHPEAVPIAGGTDLMVAVNFGRLRPEALLDLSGIAELAAWQRRDGAVRIGAGATFAQIASDLGEFPPLVQAARAVGSPQIRHRATIGGNLATASPAGDALPVLATYGGDVLLASVRGERRLRWDEFLVAPKRTALAEDELIVGVEWPVVDGPGSFAKVGTRNAMVIAIASVSLQLDTQARRVCIALGSVAPTVVRAPEAEAFASDALDWDDPQRPLPETVAREFGALAAAAAHPIDDVRGSAAYRRRAVEVLARRALAWAVDDRRAAA